MIQTNMIAFLDHFAVNSSGVVTLRRPLTDVTDSVLTVTVKVADARGLETVNPVTITVAINSKQIAAHYMIKFIILYPDRTVYQCHFDV